MMEHFKTIQTYLAQAEARMLEALGQMIRIQSGSHNKPGVDRVSAMIRSLYQGMDVSMETVPEKSLGDHLVVRTRAQGPGILLVGHMDTVFPADTDFNWYREGETHCYGPGIVDMKGGLVAGIYAMKALDHAGLLAEMPVTFVFNSDEEIGSKGSRPLIRDAARQSLFAFVLECGGLGGEVVTGRKGNISLLLSLKGEAGHAAFAGPDKASAILEMAHKTIALESLNDPSRGISANVGTFEGGIGPNTVAEHATAKVDFRFERKADYHALKEKIDRIVSENRNPRVTCDARLLSERPPMPASEQNRRLFRSVEEVAGLLGITIREEFRQGVSDANMIADEGIPVMDGLGPIGAKDHSKEEYMVKESLLSRTTLLACAMAHAWQRQKEGRLF